MRRVSGPLHCCRTWSTALQGSAESSPWLSRNLWIADGRALHSKGFPGERGQGTNVREGLEQGCSRARASNCVAFTACPRMGPAIESQ